MTENMFEWENKIKVLEEALKEKESEIEDLKSEVIQRDDEIRSLTKEVDKLKDVSGDLMEKAYDICGDIGNSTKALRDLAEELKRM